jgi:hypothetical protein
MIDICKNKILLFATNFLQMFGLFSIAFADRKKCYYKQKRFRKK